MDCKNCDLRQRQFYCETCLKSHLRDFRLQTQHFATDRNDQVTKASKALTTLTPSRIRRADISSAQNSVDALMGGLAKLRKDNDKKRERLQSLREGLATRRRTLAAAKLLPAPTANQSPAREAQELNSLSSTIARARSGLVQELVEVFNIVEVGGRPPIGGKAGTKGEWTIGDLILPVPGDIRRYPPDHINAVITHTIHFLTILTFYLGIKLPFEVTWTGGKLGVGQPWIGAGMGGESGGWAKWQAKHPLHLSSATTTTPSSPTLSPLPTALSSQIKKNLPPPPTGMSDSYVEPDPQPQSSFTTALAMLIYNVCYLAYTQSVDVPLSQAGDVLSNLWSVCCSSEIGKRSHSTTPHLAPPTPVGFNLDFAQLLQATTANPVSRVRSSRGSKARRPSYAKRERERIAEVDEEGWDLVEDAQFD